MLDDVLYCINSRELMKKKKNAIYITEKRVFPVMPLTKRSSFLNPNQKRTISTNAYVCVQDRKREVCVSVQVCCSNEIYAKRRRNI